MNLNQFLMEKNFIDIQEGDYISKIKLEVIK